MKTNTVKLCGIGILPLVVGIVINFLAMSLSVTGFFAILIELVLLILWGYLSFKAADSEGNPILQAFMLCAFGLLMLVLVLYQELVMGGYFMNFIGFGTQMFFLPFITVPASIITLFMEVVTLPPIYIAVWVGMFFVSCIGCYIKCQEKREL